MPAPAPRKPAPAPTPARPPAAAPARSAAPARPPAAAVSGPPAVRLSAPAGQAAPGEMELKGQTNFVPPAPIAEFLDARRSGTVNVRFGNLAQGPITVATVMRGKYKVTRQALPLTHPLLAGMARTAPGLTPGLVLDSEGGRLKGHVGLMAGTRVERLDKQVKESPDLLGLAGIDLSKLPSMVNQIDGGKLRLGIKGGPISLGGAFTGTISLEAIDEAITFTGGAAVSAGGLANGSLELKRDQNGLITGKASVGVGPFKNISGKIDISWDGQAITGEGKVGYQGEKLSGEVTLRLLERSKAEALERANKAPDGAALAPPDPKRRAGPVKYVLFGEGDLTFSFTSWLTGMAHVIVDPKGCVTVIGKITPQKEFILFEQKDYVRQLFKLEARAAYGIPVVGNIFIFANVGMDAFAKLGPAKFYNIAIEGTYSTDPTKAKSFSIRGSLNISAAAGLRLRGEAGAGLQILAHDIKAGAGINAIAGIKAYAEATPIVGYREKAEPGQDKKGEFFIRGELEIAAMPFLGLGGDLFVEIDAPWWSPVPDKKWTWPLASKEWPIGGSFGLGASVDYVFGSGQLPKLDFKPVEFSADKFMTDLYTDKAKAGGGERSAPGKWQEKGSKTASAPPKASPKGNAAPGKPAAAGPARPKVQPGRGPKRDRPVDPNARTAGGKTVRQHQDEAAKKGKGKGATPQSQKEDLAQPVSVEVPFSMGGASHTLTLTTGPKADLTMASQKIGKLVNKIKDTLQAIKKKDKNGKSKQFKDLGKIQKDALSVDNYLQKAKLSTKQQKTLKDRGVKLTVGLVKYAEDHPGVKDISDILTTYPPPEVGLYEDLLKDPDSPPDGTTREAHHTPHDQLATTIKTALKNALSVLKRYQDAPKAIKPVSDSYDALKDAGREKLPAILVHVTTHTRSGTGSRIHGTESLAKIEEHMFDQGLEPVYTAKGTPSVKPGESTYKRLIKEIESQVATDQNEKIGITRRKYITDIILMAYHRAKEQSFAQVTSALDGSKVDGSKGHKDKALKFLRKKIKEVWEDNLLAPLR